MYTFTKSPCMLHVKVFSFHLWCPLYPRKHPRVDEIAPQQVILRVCSVPRPPTVPYQSIAMLPVYSPEHTTVFKKRPNFLNSAPNAKCPGYYGNRFKTLKTLSDMIKSKLNSWTHSADVVTYSNFSHVHHFTHEMHRLIDMVLRMNGCYLPKRR
jgi:hypothetical protein